MEPAKSKSPMRDVKLEPLPARSKSPTPQNVGNAGARTLTELRSETQRPKLQALVGVKAEILKTETDKPKATMETQKSTLSPIPQVLKKSLTRPERKGSKQPNFAQVMLIQKLIRGYLCRKKVFFYSNACWETLFSTTIKIKGRLINLRVLQEKPKKLKTERPAPPTQIIYGNDLTEEIQFNSVPFPSRAMNARRATREKLQSMLNINVFTHAMQLKSEFTSTRDVSPSTTPRSKLEEQKTLETKPNSTSPLIRRPSREYAKPQNNSQVARLGTQEATPKKSNETDTNTQNAILQQQQQSQSKAQVIESNKPVGRGEDLRADQKNIAQAMKQPQQQLNTADVRNLKKINDNVKIILTLTSHSSYRGSFNQRTLNRVKKRKLFNKRLQSSFKIKCLHSLLKLNKGKLWKKPSQLIFRAKNPQMIQQRSKCKRSLR